MTYHLESPDLQFVLDDQKGTWSLHSTHVNGPCLEDVWMRVNYRASLRSLHRTGKREFQFLERWHKPQITKVGDFPSSHGTLKAIIVSMGPDVNGINYRVEFALSDEHPIFLWRISLENRGLHPIRVGQIEMLRAGFFPKRKLLPSPGPLSIIIQTKPIGYGAVRPSPHLGELGFFSNGWQSWSYSGVYGSNDVYRATQLGFAASRIYYSSGRTPMRKPGHFTSDMFGILGDKTHRKGILAGYASQKQQFGVLDAYITDPLYPALRLWADGDAVVLNPGADLSTDWAIIQFLDLDSPDPIMPYLDAVRRENQATHLYQKKPSPTGWCSWYQYFEDIDHEKILVNLRKAADMKSSIPLGVFQIDSGFEAKIGDWFASSPGFPGGVGALSEEIKRKGMKSGLWLSPFITHSRSDFARQHRAWLLRGHTGLPITSSYVSNNLNKAIDLTHPQSLEHIREVVRTAVEEWGYTYLKLDYLYAAGLKGRYRDRTKTRAQVLRMGLEAIRKAVGPDVELLGCGVPLGSAIGIFDSVRIGPDVAPSWEPDLGLLSPFLRFEPNLPSVRNALHNTISRAFFHNLLWFNDPDCLLVRPEAKLSLAEVRTLATAIAFSGGSMLLSDDLSRLPGDRLRIVEQLLPLIGVRPRVLDWFDSPTPGLLRLDLNNQTGRWYLLAVFNWSRDPQDINLPLDKFDLPLGEYFVREFWSGDTSRISDGILVLKGLPPHGVKLLALRPVEGDQPVYLGSSFHISQGLEVAGWSVSPQHEVRIHLERMGKSDGVVDIYYPRTPERIICNQATVESERFARGFHRLYLEFEGKANLEIR